MAPIPPSFAHDNRKRFKFAAARLGAAFAIYYVTSACVLIAFWFGWRYVKPPALHYTRDDSSFLDVLKQWDGHWYFQIAEDGYSYAPLTHSNVAFFPAYPLIARGAASVLAIDTRLALVLVSHVSLFVAIFVLISYEVVRRKTHDYPADNLLAAAWPAVVLTLWPFSLFLRTAHSESFFIMLEAIVLLGMRCNWRPWILALVIGALTACRPTGIAMVPALAVHLWSQRGAQLKGSRILVSAVWLAVACWGLLSYMVFQWAAFGQPLAFVETQRAWRDREPHAGALRTVVSLVTLEPVRDVYDSDCVCSWHRDPPQSDPFFNMSFWNPLALLATLTVVVLGWWKRVISLPEFMFAGLAVAIPYSIHAYTHCFMSGARFGIIVLPFFVVVGRALERCPGAASALCVALSTTALFAFAAEFAADYWVF